MRTCLVLDDIPDAQAWLSRAARASFPGIAVASTGSLAEARQWLAANPAPDVALIDLGLPDGSGIDLISEINRRSPATVCVVASIYDDDKHLLPALRAGAQGYILKDQSWETIATLLRGIADGQLPLSPAIARKVLAHFRAEPGESVAAPAPASPDTPRLTERETEVLALIAKGLTMPEVARQLGISHNTVPGYVKDIYRKLNISSRAQAAISARNLGLI